MKSLPAAFRLAGGILAVYATTTGGFFLVVLLDYSFSGPLNRRSGPANHALGVFAFEYVVTAAILVVAGFRLFTNQASSVGVTRSLLFAGGLGLVINAIFAAVVTVAEYKYTLESFGGSMILITVPVFTMAVVWTNIVLIVAVKLGRYLDLS